MGSIMLTKIQKLLEESIQKIQNLEIRASSKNIQMISDILYRLQIIVNTINIEMKKDERAGENGADQGKPDVQ